MHRFDESDHMFVDYAFFNSNDDNITKEVATNVLKSAGIEDALKDYEENANKNKFTYVNGEFALNKYDDYNYYNLIYSLRKCELGKSHYFDKTRENLYRQKNFFGGGLSNLTYIDEDCQDFNNGGIYFNSSFKKIESVKDIFRISVNYDEILKNFYKQYININYPEVGDEELLNKVMLTLKYELAMSNSKINIIGEYGVQTIDFEKIKQYM